MHLLFKKSISLCRVSYHAIPTDVGVNLLLLYQGKNVVFAASYLLTSSLLSQNPVRPNSHISCWRCVLVVRTSFHPPCSLSSSPLIVVGAVVSRLHSKTSWFYREGSDFCLARKHPNGKLVNNLGVLSPIFSTVPKRGGTLVLIDMRQGGVVSQSTRS